MGFFKAIGNSFALDMIESNIGTKVSIIDKGVCILSQIDTQGVFVQAHEGNFWVARAKKYQHDDACMEIDSSTLVHITGSPENFFTASIRERKPRRSGGFHMGSYEIGEWMSGATFIARSPNVLKIFSDWDRRNLDV
jgi:hypothetical protein